MQSIFNKSQAYKNQSWLPLNELHWSVTDLGTTQGAILVERLRTLGGKLFSVDEHLERMAEGAIKLGIPWHSTTEILRELCVALVDRNQAFIKSQGDVGLVLLLSPGDPGIDRIKTAEPTIMAHIGPLPFPQLRKWYKQGAALHFSRTRNVPKECWSPSIKTRSRLQYYLADRNLAEQDDLFANPFSLQTSQTLRPPDSIAILLSTGGNVTETSISNLLLLGKDGVLRSPPLTDILWGMSLKTICELAKLIELPIEFSEMLPAELYEAREVLMTGSTGCLWSAVSIEGHSIGDGIPGPVCQKLQTAWKDKIQFDFIEQANMHSS